MGHSVGQSARKRNHHLGIDTSPTERANNKRRLPAFSPACLHCRGVFSTYISTTPYYIYVADDDGVKLFFQHHERKRMNWNQSGSEASPTHQPTDRPLGLLLWFNYVLLAVSPNLSTSCNYRRTDLQSQSSQSLQSQFSSVYSLTRSFKISSITHALGHIIKFWYRVVYPVSQSSSQPVSLIGVC